MMVTAAGSCCTCPSPSSSLAHRRPRSPRHLQRRRRRQRVRLRQLQDSVRGCDVFLVQPAGQREPHGAPRHDPRLLEGLRQGHHRRRPLATSATPAPTARPWAARESIAAKLVANLIITEAGAHRVLACNLHSGQSIGYFDIPVDHVHGQPVILDYLASKTTIRPSDVVVVSPDVGGVARARAFAKKLSDAPLAIVDKRRHGHNQVEVLNLIGDVRGKVAIMVDDMIDTAGTITKGAELLHGEGARAVYACSTHAVLSPPALERLSGGLFQEVIVTNTVPVVQHRSFSPAHRALHRQPARRDHLACARRLLRQQHLPVNTQLVCYNYIIDSSCLLLLY